MRLSENGSQLADCEGDIIDCDYGSWFWVRWAFAEVTVGHSADVGDTVIMTWASPTTLPSIKAALLSTSTGSGTWEFAELDGLSDMYYYY